MVNIKYQLVLDDNNIIYETNSDEEFINYITMRIREFLSEKYGSMSFSSYNVKIDGELI